MNQYNLLHDITLLLFQITYFLGCVISLCYCYCITFILAFHYKSPCFRSLKMLQTQNSKCFLFLTRGSFLNNIYFTILCSLWITAIYWLYAIFKNWMFSCKLIRNHHKKYTREITMTPYQYASCDCLKNRRW